MIFIKNYYLNTTSEIDAVTIIHDINRAIKDSGINEGVATVIVPASGAALAIIEMLPELIEKLKEGVRAFPGEGLSTKNRRKEDVDVWPRVASAMLGRSLQIPFTKAKLSLATREEVVLIDLEEKAKRREFVVQIMGEGPAEGGEQKKAPRRR